MDSIELIAIIINGILFLIFGFAFYKTIPDKERLRKILKVLFIIYFLSSILYILL